MRKKLCGGLGPGTLKHGLIPDSDFDPVQLRVGMKIEREHTNCNELAKAISKAHLRESPAYYKKLKKAGL